MPNCQENHHFQTWTCISDLSDSDGSEIKSRFENGAFSLVLVRMPPSRDDGGDDDGAGGVDVQAGDCDDGSGDGGSVDDSGDVIRGGPPYNTISCRLRSDPALLNSNIIRGRAEVKNVEKLQGRPLQWRDPADPSKGSGQAPFLKFHKNCNEIYCSGGILRGIRWDPERFHI